MNTAEEKDKYTPMQAIIDMVAAVNSDQLHRFYEAAERYHGTVAESNKQYYHIRNLLRNRPMKVFALKELPHEVKRLLSEIPTATEEHCFMDEGIKDQFELWKKEWEYRESFYAHRIPIRNKVLLYGSTGNGKTTIAKQLARMLSLPFVQVSSAMMIDSHLGVTGRNIAGIFEQIKEPCVVFWDEIDSVATMRGSSERSAASGEKNHNVNTLLIHLEKMAPNIIFVAATNRADMLDPAFMRRFGLKMKIPLPSEQNKRLFFKSLMRFHGMDNDPKIKHPTDYSEFESYADIQLHAMEIMREHILRSIPVTEEQAVTS